MKKPLLYSKHIFAFEVVIRNNTIFFNHPYVLYMFSMCDYEGRAHLKSLGAFFVSECQA